MRSSDSDDGEQTRSERRPRMLTSDEERELVARAKDGCRRAAGELVTAFEPLVQATAARYRRSSPRGYATHDDLLSAGRHGLVEALRCYDPDHANGTRFATYAQWWVRALVRRELRGRPFPRPWGARARIVVGQYHRVSRELTTENGRQPTVEEIATRLGVKPDYCRLIVTIYFQGAAPRLDALDEEGREANKRVAAASPDELVEEAERQALLRAVLDRALPVLSDHERDVVARLENGDTCATIGEHLGVSRQRVGQLKKRAHRKLRECVEGQGVELW